MAAFLPFLALATLPAPALSSFQWLSMALSSSQANLELEGVEEGLGGRGLGLSGGDCDTGGLTTNQKKICRNNPSVMQHISIGGRDAVIECKWQFKFERWNCTTQRTPNDTDYDIFGATARHANKEAGFISAITSAGLVYSITKGCSTGRLHECNCDSNFRQPIDNFRRKGGGGGEEREEEQFMWGGCSDNVKYGMEQAQRFTDSDVDYKVKPPKVAKKTEVAEKLMILHNNRLGREVVGHSLETKCRCHGVSGSCEFKTCWRSMKEFKFIGEEVKGSYDHSAVQVAKRAKHKLKRRERADRHRRIAKHELVFLNKSPNYCDPNPRLGILGTQGRECIRDSHGSDSCKVLCCGRGYDIQIVERIERCQCKFVWCCHVKCKDCRSRVEVTTCK